MLSAGTHIKSARPLLYYVNCRAVYLFTIITHLSVFFKTPLDNNKINGIIYKGHKEGRFKFFGRFIVRLGEHIY